ncbi:AbrB/MazE/SpoVT family DNA-binding domain-containing protein [Nostoc sp. NIES-2111]
MSFATVTSKGQLTLPAELRREWNIKAGEKVEFYKDHTGRVCVRPMNAGPLDFLKGVQRRKPLSSVSSDDDAIAIAVRERDERSRSKKAAE